MQHDHSIDLSKRKFTSRLIIERALERGWHVTGFDTNSSILLIKVPGREQPVKIFSASPPQMSYPSSKVVDDKFITNQLLAANGILVPGELLYQLSNPPSEEKILAFLNKYKNIVVKPLDSGHGKGITVNIRSLDDMHTAIATAQLAIKGRFIILQQQITGIDIRIVTIDYEFADSMLRSPARVMGDGEHTVRDLISLTNQSPDRGKEYKTRLNTISEDRALRYLGEEMMSKIPHNGEIVEVAGISNIGVGGDRQNVKHDIPDCLKVLAQKASEILELPVCGVDFMVSQPPKSDMMLADLNPYIIEANACPSLTVYEDLKSPEQAALIDQYLDLLLEY